MLTCWPAIKCHTSTAPPTFRFRLLLDLPLSAETLHDLYFPTAVQLVFNNNLQVFKATRDMRTALAQFAVATPFCYSFASNATLSKVNGLTNQGGASSRGERPKLWPAALSESGAAKVHLPR